MTTPRLSRRTLTTLPPSVRRPAFDPAALSTGIVHLGIGAFARAHLACYTQPLLATDPTWGIRGISLRSPDTRDALAPQDCLYTRAERDGTGERLEIMAALTGLDVGPTAALPHLIAPTTRIVTLTVTEKGYHRDATGSLDESHPHIQADLTTPDAPATVPALLVAALRARRAAGIAPFTVLSCDNLPANGDTTRRVLTRFADLIDPALGRHIANDVAFPNCMVDRIVPATTAADRARVDAALNLHDAWPVIHEPFAQWVIEDNFPQSRPAWETTGAELVTDVRPYEDMKLRLLNGSHSTIAYIGQLAGWQTVAGAIAQPALAAHIAALMTEIATTLLLPASTDLASYRAALLTRFANPALQHRTAQIAMDGSQKLPQRLFAPALDRLSAGRPAPRIALGVAAWLRFLQGRADDGTALDLNDPQAARLRDAARAAATPTALRDAIFRMTDIVPPDLARNETFGRDVLAAFDLLATQGANATLHYWNDLPTNN
jgi:fructuronate reductase